MTETELFAATAPAIRLYEEKLKPLLVPTHKGQLIAVEPETGGYVIHPKFGGISEAAYRAFPGKVTYIIRIGFRSAAEISYAPPEEEEEFADSPQLVSLPKDSSSNEKSASGLSPGRASDA